MAKNLVLGTILAHLVHIRAANLLDSTLAVTRYYGQSLDIMVSYHHVQYQKKLNNPILRKLSDRQMGRWTDKSDFIGRYKTNGKHPIEKL